MRDWLAYWRAKSRGCQHEWQKAWRPTKNPNTGPLIMYCPKCKLPYYRMLEMAVVRARQK